MTPFSDHISPVAATTSLNVCAFMIYTFHGFRHRFSAFSFWSFFLMGRSPMPACPSRFLTLRLCPGIFSLPSSSPPSASWGRPLRLFIDSLLPSIVSRHFSFSFHAFPQFAKLVFPLSLNILLGHIYEGVFVAGKIQSHQLSLA
jgi:hypothetical protein